jgi:hypothetical protein
LPPASLTDPSHLDVHQYYRTITVDPTVIRPHAATLTQQIQDIDYVEASSPKCKCKKRNSQDGTNGLPGE